MEPIKSGAATVVIGKVKPISASDAVVDAWFFETFHNVPLLSTELFNRFNSARDELKKRLRAEE